MHAHKQQRTHAHARCPQRLFKQRLSIGVWMITLDGVPQLEKSLRCAEWTVRAAAVRCWEVAVAASPRLAPTAIRLLI